LGLYWDKQRYQRHKGKRLVSDSEKTKEQVQKTSSKRRRHSSPAESLAPYDWRVETARSMARMSGETKSDSRESDAKDFKTASQELHFENQASAAKRRSKEPNKEWMKPVEAPVAAIPG